MSDGYEDWDLFNAVMAAGWVAVTVPAVLGNNGLREAAASHSTATHNLGRMRRRLFDRFPELIARDAKDIVLLASLSGPRFLSDESLSAREHIEMMRMMLSHPRRTVRSASWGIGLAKKKILRRDVFQKFRFLSRIMSRHK
jgi:hypothetical protein